MLVELVQKMGLYPKRISSTQGGEFHSACPDCGGNDRFIIWPKIGRYWCRQCKKSGDEIQFCRDFMGMAFQEACLRVGSKVVNLLAEQSSAPVFFPSKSWEDKGRKFVESSHQRLLVDPKGLDSLKTRGLTLETIQRYSLGWHPLTLFPKREEWGLEKKVESGKEKKLWLPSGFVIPTFQEQALMKIKIRRNDWKEDDKFGKYYIVPGSKDCISVFGDSSKDIVVVVEAEFDAMLVAQEVGSHCCCIALGGAQKRPDASLHQWLQGKELVIFALDFDEAGKKEYVYWRSNFENLFAWPVPIGKSPAEAWQLGVNLKKWILSGLGRMKGDSEPITPDLVSD